MSAATPELPDATKLLELITRSVRRVYETDSVLIRDRTHERTILFHVGRHVAAEVDNWAGEWRVDLEYDRFHAGETDVVRKYLNESPWRRAGAVVPDLIVHDRSESSPWANLLVLEAKVRPRPAQRANELRKLAAYLSGLSYQHAVYVEFPAYPITPTYVWLSHLEACDDSEDRLRQLAMW